MANATHDSPLKLAGRNILRATALYSAIFATLVLLLWVHSYVRTVIFEWSGGIRPAPIGGSYSFLTTVSAHGGLSWHMRTYESPSRYEHDPAHYFGTHGTIISSASGYPNANIPSNKLHFSMCGFTIAQGNRVSTSNPLARITETVVIIPDIVLVLLLSILPLLVLQRRRRQVRQTRRAKDTQCLACGYDLRHSSLRCPECGQEIIPAPQPPCTTFGDELRLVDSWQQRAIGLLLSIFAVVAFAQLHFFRDHFDERTWQYFFTRRQPEEVFLTFAGVWGALIGNLVRSQQMYRLWNLTAIGLLVLAALLILSRADYVEPGSVWIFLACCAISASYAMWTSRREARQPSWTTSKTNA